MSGPGPNSEGLFIDARMGGVKKYFHGPKPKDFEMRVSSDLKLSVCFLCGKKAEDTYEVLGTGFFVNKPSESRPKDVWHVYLITAKHLVDTAKAQGYSNLHLRINTRSGSFEYLEVPDNWKYPKTEGADVAVLPIYKLGNDLAVATMPLQMALADEVSIEAHGVGIGDEVLMVGLFTKRYGYLKNIPIVRGGIIAAMPEEPIENEDTGKLYDAYLIEIHSISGLSGSPVIVFKDELARYMPNPDCPTTETNGYLLGLVRGHWRANNIEMADSASADDGPQNTGIATVTPIKEALSIINGPELEGDRRHRDRLRAAANAPVLD